MSELADTLRDAVAALAASDPHRRRFGAAAHGYALTPPLTQDALAAVEQALGAALPDELRAFAADVAAGGAGPGYGLVPIERAAAFAVVGPAGAPWTRGLPIVHLGCGYAAVVALDGAARGEIWTLASAVGVCAPLAPGFLAFYIDWVDRLARARWPEPVVPAGACALAGALSGYLARCEADAGVAPGALGGAALAEALGQLGPGAIAIAGSSAIGWFADDDRVDPCIACARMLDELAGSGLRRDAVAPGVPPRPQRAPGPGGEGIAALRRA